MDTLLSYNAAKDQLAELLDRATGEGETIIITRPGKPAAAIIAVSELESMRETLHLLSSPANATHLFRAIEQADRGEVERLTPAELRRKLNLDQ